MFATGGTALHVTRRRFARPLTLAAGAVAALALSAAASGAVRSASTSRDTATVVVGANLELTGIQASIGLPFRDGIQLATHLINARGFKVAGKLYRLKVDIQDNRSDIQQGLLIQRGFQQQGVKFILGPAASNIFVPGFQALSGYDYINLTPAAGALPFLGTPQGKYLYQVHMPELGPNGREAQIVRVLEKKYHPRRVAILLPQDANGELFARAFSDAFKAAGTPVVYAESFPPATVDFSSYITAIKAANPDMIVQGYLNTRTAPFLQQAVSAGLTSAVFVAGPGGDQAALAGVTNAVHNYVWSVATRSVLEPSKKNMGPKDLRGIRSYRAAYKKFYGKPPSITGFWALSYYDPLLMLVKAMQQAGSVTDVGSIAAQLSKVRAWMFSAMPDRRFSSGNQALYTPQIGVFRDGKISFVNAK